MTQYLFLLINILFDTKKKEINFNIEALTKPNKKKMLCAICLKPSTKKCAQCHLTYYCSPEHQKQDWSVEHKYHCVSYQHAQNASHVCEIMFQWYTNTMYAPRTMLEQKRHVALELMMMLHVVTTFESLRTNHMIRNAIALQLIRINIEMNMHPIEFQHILVNVQRLRDTKYKHVIAQITKQMAIQRDIGNFECLIVPFTLHTRSLDVLRRAPHYFAHDGFQVVCDENMNGLDVIADRSFQKGDMILNEEPIAAASLDMFGMCYHCCTVFGTKAPTQCRNKCGMCYCNDECEVASFVNYHAPLCSHAGMLQLKQVVLATIKEDPNSIGGVQYSLLLLKFCGMQMLASHTSLWEQEPLCYFHCAKKTDDEINLRHTMLPYYVFMQVILAIAHENKNFERPSMIDVSWFLRMTQYLWQNIFGGGYDRLTIPIDIGGNGSSIRFARLATLFNHSCVPNIDFKPNVRHATSQSYVALRNIAKGESLRISYLQLPTKIALYDQYNFNCDCSRCNLNNQL